MARLGYDRYGAQGGDWGSMRHDGDRPAATPSTPAGIHLNMPIALPDAGRWTTSPPQEQAALDSLTHYQRWDSGYSKQQSTRPQTLGYGLVDSPAGQAAWIVEKFWAWTDCDGHPENVLTRDELLDNVMLYWLPDTGASSARLYWESFHDLTRLDAGRRSRSGCSIFPKEIFRPSRRWAETRFTDIRYWNELDKGGHFAAFEQPEMFVDEVRASFVSCADVGAAVRTHGHAGSRRQNNSTRWSWARTRWNRSSNSSGDVQSRSPRPARPAQKVDVHGVDEVGIQEAPNSGDTSPRRTSLPSAAAAGPAATHPRVGVEEMKGGVRQREGWVA